MLISVFFSLAVSIAQRYLKNKFDLTKIGTRTLSTKAGSTLQQRPRYILMDFYVRFIFEQWLVGTCGSLKWTESNYGGQIIDEDFCFLNFSKFFSQLLLCREISKTNLTRLKFESVPYPTPATNKCFNGLLSFIYFLSILAKMDGI